VAGVRDRFDCTGVDSGNCHQREQPSKSIQLTQQKTSSAGRPFAFDVKLHGPFLALLFRF